MNTLSRAAARLRSTNLIGLAAVAVISMALGGTAAIAGGKLISGKQIKNESVTGKDIKNGSLKSADFKAGQLPEGPEGPEGPPGSQGPQGNPGAPGSARAYGYVAANGDVDFSRSKNVSSVEVASPGKYCIMLFQSTGATRGNSAIFASPDYSMNDSSGSKIIHVESAGGAGVCTDPAAMRVETFAVTVNSGALQSVSTNQPFYFVVP